MVQTTNIRRILDRVMRHPMMRDIPFETAIEYAVDFISLMGTPALYDEKTAIVPINEWKGALPCDFVKMIQVRAAGTQHSNRWSNCSPAVLPMMYRESGNSFHMSDYKPGVVATGEFTYKIQNMVIFTSTRDIDVEIAYRGFAVDDEGYPLLPDNTSFLRGLEAYIKLQWFTVLFDMGKLPYNVFNNVQQEYAWAAGDAQSEFSRLNLDKAETLFNSFKTLLPRNFEHQRGFLTNGSKEVFLHGGVRPNGISSGVAPSNPSYIKRGGLPAKFTPSGKKSSSHSVNPSAIERIIVESPVMTIGDDMHLYAEDPNGNIVDLGKVGLTFASSPWNANTEYEKFTYVIYSGDNNGYISKQKNRGVTPGTNTQVWALATKTTVVPDGGGSGDDPTPSRKLNNPIYYGGMGSSLPISSSTGTVVSTFASSDKYITENVECNSKYYYIAVPNDYTLKSVVSVNTENITSLFQMKGSYGQGEIIYKLYEFHLSSDIPLGADITITIA